MAELRTPLFQPQPREKWVQDLVRRAQRRLQDMSEEALVQTLEDALYTERKRLERCKAEPGELDNLERLSHALVRGDARERIDAALTIVAFWGEEIHGKFDPRVYKFATRVLPRALTGILSERPKTLRGLRHWDLSMGKRLRAEGDTHFLRELTQEATLVLVPTHVSNMDSALLGMALYQADLPPFVYGAGLNLFENPVIGWWLRRLGAYTVDRRKRASLYKETLKDYSVLCMRAGLHSLFFPGGTRCRSGALEDRLKKGLLGTTFQAWQENIDAGDPRPDVYIVPCTLSYQLVLEAPTLINDHLAEAGRGRYIIEDDEFSKPTVVANFLSRVLNLDASTVVRFGAPLDLFGTPVPRDAQARQAASERRRRYVCDSDGAVEWDEQRDNLYTSQLASSIVDAYKVTTTVLTTHLACHVAWNMLAEQQGTTDPFRLVRTDVAGRHLLRSAYLERLEQTLSAVKRGAEQGMWHHDLPATALAVLEIAVDRFGRFHKSKALADHGGDLIIEDPRLCLYYQNRLAGIDLAAFEPREA
ncbi:MAG: 1-acyl-sn-glycerol-3-phosphate acyltransferase [Myxococcota bacterium]